jgi:hypothetical protein
MSSRRTTQEVYKVDRSTDDFAMLTQALCDIANELKRANDLKMAEIFDETIEEKYLRYCSAQNVKTGSV